MRIAPPARSFVNSLIIAIVLMLGTLGAPGKNWYASPTATITGNGSITNPWPLSVALQMKDTILPGDSLLLRGGRYRGAEFSSNLTGNPSNYVTVRSYPGEWAIVSDGEVGVLGTNLDVIQSEGNSFNVIIRNSESWQSGTYIWIGTERMQLANLTSPTNWHIYRGITPEAHPVGSPVYPSGSKIIGHAGSYVTFRDFEITSYATTNRTIDSLRVHTVPSGLDLSAEGHGNKAVNLVIHNTGHPAIGFWQQGDGGEINGCIMWGIGEYDYSGGFAGTTRGMGVYSQNSTGTAYFKNNIVFRTFTGGMKVFGESGPVQGVQFVNNIVFGTPDTPLQMNSGSTATSDLWMIGNQMMGSPHLSYVSIGNSNQYFFNNLVVNGSLALTEHVRSVYTNNTFLMRRTPGYNADFFYRSAYLYKTNLFINWDYNTYYVGNPSYTAQWTWETLSGRAFGSDGGAILYFENDQGKSWKDWSGFDAHSTLRIGWPTNFLNVAVRRLDYDTNQFYINIVSTSGQTNLAFTPTLYGFPAGAAYDLVDAQNWPNLIASGNYTGGSLNLPLNLKAVAPVYGSAPFTNEHSNVQYPGLFNTFILRRRTSTALLPPTSLLVNE